MLRRSLLARLSSAFALMGLSLRPVSATEPVAPSPAPDSSVREPGPIVIEPATAERARRILDAIAQGTFDRAELAPQIAPSLPANFIASGAQYVAALGTPESMYPFEKRITEDRTATYFRVKYPRQTLTWVIGIDGNDKIIGLSLRKNPHNKIFNISYHDIEY